jgi:transposase-like protein
LGRKVYYGVAVVLLPILMERPTPKRVQRLQQLIGVSARTLRRWRRWWRESVAGSRFFAGARGAFATPVVTEALPGSLLAAFSGLTEPAERLVAVLRWLTPLSTGSNRAGVR